VEVAAIAAIVVLLLSVVSFLRGIRMQSELRNVNARLDALERRLDGRESRLEARLSAPLPRAEPSAPRAEQPRPVGAGLHGGPLEPEARPLRDILHTPVAHPSADELEGRIGGRWLQHAGMIVLVLGVAFFLRYAFDRAWLSPAVRIALGGVAGGGMTAAGLWLSRRYRAYGLFLAGGGIAVLYLSVYAGLNLYSLVGPELAFALLVVITGAAAALADRTNSQALAVMAVCGGFATPFLVGGDRDEHVTLFTYVALIVAATTYLAHRRAWPWLNVVSMVLTGATVLAWAAAYYTADKYLRIELFATLYCALFVDSLRKSLQRPSQLREPIGPAHFLLLAPVGYHVWSVVTLQSHPLAFLVYVIAFTLVAVLAGVHYRLSAVRAIAWVAVAFPLAIWIGAHHWRSWEAASIVTILGVYAVHLAAQVRAVREGEELDAWDVALVHANSVGVYAALFQVLTDTLSVAQLALLALVFAAANAGLWTALRRAAPVTGLHWAGVACTLVAVAIWMQLGGPWAVAAWATEAAVVFWIAARTGREWLQVGAWALLAMAAWRWLQADVQETTTAFVPLVNARALTGIYLVAMTYVAAWLQPNDVARTANHRHVLVVAASVVTLIVISTEIMSFWAVRSAVADADVAREMMLSAAWVSYAALLVVIGMRRRYAPIRYFAIVLFGVTLLKVFVVDLATLAGIYRVAGFLVVGLILLIVSFLYQRGNADAATVPPE
jgi:uncharacterized membrane protein